jgi:hypothetical protein
VSALHRSIHPCQLTPAVSARHRSGTYPRLTSPLRFEAIYENELEYAAAPVGDCMRFAWFCCALVIFAQAMMLAQSNPVPFVNQVLDPASVQPGRKEFLLTVKGTGFASTAVINWNGSPILTSVESASRLTSRISAAKVRKGRYRFHHGDESRSNKGGTTLSITQITISGKNSGDFAQK